MITADKPALVRAYAFPADKTRDLGLCSAPAADMCARLVEYGLTPEVVFDAEGAMECIMIPEAEKKELEFLKRMAPGKFYKETCFDNMGQEMNKVCIDSIRDMADEVVPLYCRYPRQSLPQEAYIALRDDGRIIAFYLEYGENFPEDILKAWEINPRVTGRALLKICKGLIPECERILRERPEFDISEIETDDNDLGLIVTPSEWFENYDLDRDWPLGMTLSEAAEHNRKLAESCPEQACFIDEKDGDIESELLRLAEREYDADRLSRMDIIRALFDAGRIDELPWDEDTDA